MKCAFVGAIGVVLSLALCAMGQTPPRYIVVEIAPSSPQSFAYVADINNLGQVTGDVGPTDGNTQAFRTGPNAPFNSATDMIDLRIGPFFASGGMSINDLGQVAGGGNFGGDESVAFRTPANGTIDPARDGLGELAPGGTWAWAINSSGQVVGNSGGRAYRTGPNARINPLTDDLGTLGGEFSGAEDINSSGVVVGTSNLANGTMHAFRSLRNGVDGPLTDLGTLPGGNASRATGINDEGWVVGFSDFANGMSRAFRTAPGALIDASSDLGTLGGSLSLAWDINNSGWVVGHAATAEGPWHAFLHDGVRMWDLNDLLPEDSPWLVVDATAINDRGQIIAYVFGKSGEGGGFVRLDPVPEPVTLGLMCGALWLAGRRSQRELH